MAEPSKVIHVRNVGHEITENDLLQLVQPFGSVTKLVMLRTKNQALMQMQDVASAINLVDYYTNLQPSVRGRNVYMQFSSHQELTTDQTQGRKSDTDGQPNRILLVSIHHVIYPMTVDVLHQVFSPYGFVEKIVTFQKSAGFQALIQYETRQNASSAMSALHGRNIYDGCCQLDIQYSNLTELQVNYNNDRSRDFTNPNLPTEQRGRSSQQHGYGDGAGMLGIQAAGPVGFSQVGNAAAMAAFAGGLPPGVSGTNDRCTVIVSNLNPDKIDEDKLFNLFSLYGNIVRIKLLRSKPDHALVEMSDGFQAELAVHFLKGATLFGKRLEVNFSKYPNITPSPDTHDYQNSNLNRFNRNVAKHYRYCCSPTKMIHLSSIPEDITEEEIIDLMEEHGTVISTKLFEANSKKQALVLFETEEQATEALVCKNATSVGGSVIRISFSQSQAT
uniref:RRM domain-containing protein n=1 Tax=Opuntia streptacantha TaxID=393608 RepID=A0A7C9EGN8_OPUST